MSSTNLFDLGDQYAEMLHNGIQLSGEDQLFFIEGRLRDLKSRLASAPAPRRILDFGCGIGVATARLAEWFPDAEILGVDTALQAIEYAREHFGSERIRFGSLDALDSGPSFELAHCNGVFHHIPPADRIEAARRVYQSLAEGGRFALFENNPLNPGTRMVMSRIPFDRDAITLTPWETVGLLRDAGFETVLSPRFLFYFPRRLAFLRPLEPALARVPMGAQYYAMGVKRD